jgi:hypothetical protein
MITAEHLPRIFEGFQAELSTLHVVREHFAHEATEALQTGDVIPVKRLQNVLRAAVGIALASDLPPAIFIESARLWRAKVEAHCDGLDGSIPEGWDRLRFDLLRYGTDEWQDVLVTTLALPPFRSAPARYMQECLENIERKPRLKQLRAWREGVSQQAILSESRKLAAHCVELAGEKSFSIVMGLSQQIAHPV